MPIQEQVQILFPSGGPAQGLDMGVIGIIIIIAVIGGGIFLLIRRNPFHKFPVVVKVNELRKDGKKVVSFTKARREGKLGGEQEYVLKNGDRISAQSYMNLDITAKGKDFLELDKYEDGRYIPHVDTYSNPSGKKKDIELNYEDVNYLNWKIRKNIEKFKSGSFWKEYTLPIVMVMVLFTCGILIYITVQYGIIPIVNKGNDMAKANAQYMVRYENMTHKWMTFMEEWMGRFDKPVAVT